MEKLQKLGVGANTTWQGFYLAVMAILQSRGFEFAPVEVAAGATIIAFLLKTYKNIKSKKS